jgi:hypothetical protein
MHDEGLASSADSREPRSGLLEAGPAALEELAGIAQDLGAMDVARDARGAADRLRDRRFLVASVGQFKRGKSTLLNALVGHDVLPVGVAPVTSVVTILRHGRTPAARLRLVDGREQPIALEDIGAYVDERRNPGNRLGVAAVEVWVPSSILETGLCLVDTPGVGSVFTANTDATRAFLPQVDAALVVLGADPPVSKAELDLALEIAGDVDDLVFVLNKADRSTPADLEEARAFTAQVLASRFHRALDRLLEVSARERIERGRATRDWAALERRLAELAGAARSRILVHARGRALKHVSRRLLAEIAEREGALVRPLHLTEARVERLRRALADADRSLVDLGHLFSAAEMNLGRAFAQMRTQFVSEARPRALADLDAWIDTQAGRVPRGRLRGQAFDAARAITTRAIQAWLEAIEPRAEDLYERTTERFVTLANEFLGRLATGGTEGHLEVDRGFHERRHFYAASLMSLTAAGPLAWLGDRLLPRAWRVRRVARAARGYAAHLFSTNTMRVENDLRERVLESRRWLEHAIRARLGEAVESGERALTDAHVQRAAGEQAVTGRLAHLRLVRARVDALAGSAGHETDGAR